MARAALKIVERAPFYTRQIELWDRERPREAHSLHYLLSLPGSFRPEVPAYFIDRFTEKGDVVLDPFCGSGATPLEAALRGRVAFGSDLNPLAALVTEGKLSPADITEVTLGLQRVNTGRPVQLESFNKYFAPFYDVNTFREIYNLKRYFSEQQDRIAQFLQLIALSLLHGHSAGFFSVYTLPQVSLSPAEQVGLNDRRNQIPDYRAVMPRMLRRAAGALRDGIPSVLGRMGRRNHVSVQDARALDSVPTSSVDLVVTAPPLPRFPNESVRRRDSAGIADMWLKLWFAGIPREVLEDKLFLGADLEEWLEFLNEVLIELARVVRPGGRAVLDLRKQQAGRTERLLDDEVIRLVEEKLGAYWEVEALFLAGEKAPRLEDCVYRDSERVKQESRLLMLRRR